MDENCRPLAAMNTKQIAAVDDAFCKSFPPGYRFRPTKKELINYLKARVCNEPLPANRIRQVNLYNSHPQELTRMYKLVRENEWYFFTPRDRKYPNGSRPNRAAADGYWKPTGKDISITVDGIRGFRKSLDYYEGKHPTGKKTNWKMHEYRLHEDIAPPNKKGVNGMKLDDWVLCKVYEKSKKSKDKKDESIETKICDERVPVMCATSQYEGNSTLNIEPNSLMEVHGNYSKATNSTPWNNSLSCCDYACQEPLQHQPSAYYNWELLNEYFTNHALPNYDMKIENMSRMDDEEWTAKQLENLQVTMQSSSSELPTHVREDNQPLPAEKDTLLPENDTSTGSKEENTDDYVFGTLEDIYNSSKFSM